MNKVCLVIFILLTLPTFVIAASKSHWSAEFKGGLLYPAQDNWEQNYGNDRTAHVAATIAYKFLPWLELGMAGGHISDRGIARQYVYELYPVNVYAMFRLRFTDGQWVVPYVSGGIDRLHYRISVRNDIQRKGGVTGSHARAGLQFMLDAIDKKAFWALSNDLGVEHVYFILEALKRNGKENTTQFDLGGTSYLAGFMFEF